MWFRRIQLQENQERRAFPPFPPDSLVLRTLVLRMSDCPSPTLTAQPESGQLMPSTY
uniref:ACRS-like protein n=27 Tax=Aquifoliales TaxID=91883 RepID=A0AA96LVV6_9AQUA|nr:putative ACRS-like protein [Helwingia himalaica]YP_009306533.1 putative ACRS-like protein [Helwingia himalaica]YP_009713951.1 putative ACRS-like protein [Ilex asprella]YP_009713965.1 putative ACRS-like protein [Ilex asprella]YP_009763425.1 putative ACRS-like protein [Ilex latifolia]YP_009763440.1 putative ACRS-like protein [Ilex latifolia]YP_010571012.1 putative ACRS-like protein [Ilex fukienensis]YP_010571024.1 putative ACRS-like protein [Ilex fukienensis]YP_010571285.1 putative ACRS-li